MPHDDAASAHSGLIQALTAALGPSGVITDHSEMAPFCADWRGNYRGAALAVLRPANTAEVSTAVKLCAEAGVAIVPQGGNTGLMGGATPSASGGQVVLSLARMRAVRFIDPVDLSMVVEAGLPLAAAQEAAEAAGCTLPLSIASEGSATMGGVLSTNAGGNNTLRYGNARDIALGIEVVLPDGSVINALRRLRKDNTGYCLRQLFIGAEGTLGIITAAAIKLVPRLADRQVALCALPSPEAALALLGAFQKRDAASLLAFEYMGGAGMGLVLRHIPGATLPLSAPADHYVLVELAGSNPGGGLRATLEEVLETCLEDGTVLDAAIAESDAQRTAIWRLREEHAEAQKREGASVKNDVSVPVSHVARFIHEASAACDALIPGIRIVAFGHLGDGNIHFNLAFPPGSDQPGFLARADEMMDTVNEVVRRHDGSFSAEHGIGQLKPRMLADWRGGAEIDAMRRIKAALDPANLFNPGKVLS